MSFNVNENKRKKKENCNKIDESGMLGLGVWVKLSVSADVAVCTLWAL